MPDSPNDQRSNVKNPNNPAHKQDRDNRSDQMNPNNDAHPSRQAGGGGSSSSGASPDQGQKKR